MAENAVHISSTQHSRPTIFELCAQDSLMSTLQPAFRIIVDALSSQNFSRYDWLLKWHDEAFLVLNLLLQHQYLEKFHASFSEAFYGLKRVSRNGGELTTKLKLKSLLCIALVPYLVSKLKSHINKLNQKEIKNKENIEIFIKTSLAILDLSKLFFFMRYMSGKSRTHNIFDKWSEIKLTHETASDLSWSEFFTQIKSLPKFTALLSIMIKLSSQSLELGAFFLQFLNWWNTHEFNTSITALPVPEPPSSSIAYEICSLCFNNCKAQVALQSSGYIFCYPCIKQHLDLENKCPITNIPATTKDLIRIYVV